MPIARTTGSAALSVRLDIRQLRHQRANASHDVGLFVPEVVEERTQRRTQEAELVIAEFESVHGREPNARARGEGMRQAAWSTRPASRLYALMSVEAGAMRRAQAPIRGCSSWESII